jgi:hypothetical protein
VHRISPAAYRGTGTLKRCLELIARILPGELSPRGIYWESTFAGFAWGGPVVGSVIYDQDLLAGHESGTVPLGFTLATDTSDGKPLAAAGAAEED